MGTETNVTDNFFEGCENISQIITKFFDNFDIAAYNLIEQPTLTPLSDALHKAYELGRKSMQIK